MTLHASAEQAFSPEETLSLEAVSDTLMALSRIIGSAPDHQQILAFANSVRALGEDVPGCKRMIGYFEQHADQPQADTAQELGVDWTLAFRGVNPSGGPRPPYAGAWLASDRVGVDAMMEVNSRYIDHGLGRGEAQFNRMDYLGVEVEFVAHLLEECAAAAPEEQGAIADEAAEFLDKFILSWLPRYRADVEAKCKTEFWKGYLELLETVLGDVSDQCASLAA